MAQRGGLKVPAWHRWTVGARQHSEGLGWRLATSEYCSPDLALILADAQERKKVKPTDADPGPRDPCAVAAIDKYTRTKEILWRERDCTVTL